MLKAKRVSPSMKKTRNVTWLSAIPHRLNVSELSQEELWHNIFLRYGMMTQDIPATCNGFNKKFSIDHGLPCLKGGIVLERHGDATKDWDILGLPGLTPSAISY